MYFPHVYGELWSLAPDHLSTVGLALQKLEWGIASPVSGDAIARRTVAQVKRVHPSNLR